METTPTQDRIGRPGQRRQAVIPREILETLNLRARDFLADAQRGDSVVIKRANRGDSHDTLTPKEGALLKNAEREMKQGKYVTPAQLHDDLGRKGSPRRRCSFRIEAIKLGWLSPANGRLPPINS
jgi:bifunctional DNA-binding transcriptional regulator/antitoxin component of YhaV-PrlF toxin-antitoxin module